MLEKFCRPKTTSYENFYEYAVGAGINHQNPILLQMEEARDATPEDTTWSDIESAIGRLDPSAFKVGEVQLHLLEIQRLFAAFLNEIVDPALLAEIDNLSSASDLAIHSFAHLLEDITDRRDMQRVYGRLPGHHGTTFHHTIVNFNYTDLLDNYIYLDSAQFDPRPLRVSQANFQYNNDPRGLLIDGSTEDADNIQFCHLYTQILHPHGRQSTPRSLLFGTGDLLDHTAQEARLAKPFRAQYEENYSNLFSESDIFIIFGCSLGESDSWWWNGIVNALQGDEGKVLLLYTYGANSADATVDRLLRRSELDPTMTQAVRAQIIAIEYTGATDHTFLGMKEECDKCVTDSKGLGYKALHR